MKILRARLYEMEMEKRREKLDAVEASKKDIAFGSQIRSYVLHPYRMVKDLRTRYEVGNADRVLDGDLDDLINATLVARAKGTLGQPMAAGGLGRPRQARSIGRPLTRENSRRLCVTRMRSWRPSRGGDQEVVRVRSRSRVVEIGATETVLFSAPVVER